MQSNEIASRGGARNEGAAALHALMTLADRQDVMSFAGGLPASCLLPAAAAARAAASILAHPGDGAAALQYSPVEGYGPLRQWIARHMIRLGVPCEVDNILVTSGSQQALDLLGRVLLPPFGTVLAPMPTYVGAIQAFSPMHPHYVHVDPSTPQGCLPGIDGAPALAYAVPDFSNPTGEVMDEPSRIRMLDLCDALRIPLIEDAAYSSLSFGQRLPPSCMALSAARCGSIDRSRVAYCGTFSKVVSPGLRVGWICASRALMAKLVPAKQAADLQASSLGQMVVHRMVSDEAAGYSGMAVAAARAYAHRCSAMMQALQEHMPAGVSWTRPGGGMFTWLTLPEMDSTLLLERAVREEQISFVPGPAFYPLGGGSHSLRLSWSQQDEAGIRDGMSRLGRLLRAA